MKKNSLQVGKIYKLSELKIDNEAEIVEFKSDKILLLRRMFDLGLIKGTRVKVKKIAPLGGIMCFEVKGYELGLRKEELESIFVRLVV